MFEMFGFAYFRTTKYTDMDLIDRLREIMADVPDVEEITMFGGACFMVDGKMCVCARRDHLLCRVGPEEAENVIEQHGVRQMEQSGRPMKGYVYVDAEIVPLKKDIERWVSMCLNYNPLAKAARKKP